MKTAALPSPLPAIRQTQNKEWKQYVDEIALLAVEEDKRALDMGDVFLEVEGVFGKDLVYEMASQAGVGRMKARQRLNVSRKIPKGHYLRETHLTFSHLRLLAPLSEKMDEWGKECLDKSWSVEELEEQLKVAGDIKAQEMGVLCGHCNQAIPSREKMVAFSIHGQKRGRLCGVACAKGFFVARAEEELAGLTIEPVDPESEESSVEPEGEELEQDAKARKKRSKKSIEVTSNGAVYTSVFDDN